MRVTHSVLGEFGTSLSSLLPPFDSAAEFTAAQLTPVCVELFHNGLSALNASLYPAAAERLIKAVVAANGCTMDASAVDMVPSSNPASDTPLSPLQTKVSVVLMQPSVPSSSIVLIDVVVEDVAYLVRTARPRSTPPPPY